MQNLFVASWVGQIKWLLAIALACLPCSFASSLQAKPAAAQKLVATPSAGVLNQHLRDITIHVEHITVTGIGTLYVKATGLRENWSLYLQDSQSSRSLLDAMRCSDKVVINAQDRSRFTVGNSYVQIRIWGANSYDEINYFRYGKYTYIEDKQLNQPTLEGSFLTGSDARFATCLHKLVREARTNPNLRLSDDGRG